MGSVKPTTEMRNQVFVASKIKQKIAIMLDRPVPQPELHQNDGPTLGATRKRCTMCQKAATRKGYSKKIPFPMSRHFVSLVVMQHVRNICFKNALYLDSDSMYSDFFYRLG